MYLRQSTAVDLAIGPFVDDADGVTALTALTIAQADVRLKKNNGAWAQINDNTSATHEENGWYEKEFNTTDTDTVGRLLVAVHESGALPVWHEFWVLEEAIYDALFAASATGLLPANATQFAGQTISAAAGVTIPSSIASPTNITAGTITTVTNLTNAPTNGDLTATMKTSVTTAATAATPIAASVTGNVGGNVTGSIGSLATQAKADVNAEVDAAISDAALATAANLATVAGYLDTEIAATLAIAQKLDTALELDGAVYRLTLNALELAPTGGSAPTASAIADEVETRTIAGVTTVGSVTGAVGSVTGNVGGNVAGSVGSVTATVTVGTNNDKTGYRLSSTALDDILRTALTEAYANLGAAPTLSQLLFEVRALLAEKAVSSTTLTTKKLDGSTTAATYTLDSDTAPTSITRAS
jgi:hypothetical protein